MSDLNEAAFARPRSEGTIKSSIGLTKREYAAIHLRVPMSGNPELDAMIREAQRNELAARAMEGLVSQLNLYHVSVDEVAELSYRQADAMLKEREK
jgi:aconitase B